MSFGSLPEETRKKLLLLRFPWIAERNQYAETLTTERIIGLVKECISASELQKFEERFQPAYLSEVVFNAFIQQVLKQEGKDFFQIKIDGALKKNETFKKAYTFSIEQEKTRYKGSIKISEKDNGLSFAIHLPTDGALFKTIVDQLLDDSILREPGTRHHGRIMRPISESSLAELSSIIDFLGQYFSEPNSDESVICGYYNVENDSLDVYRVHANTGMFKLGICFHKGWQEDPPEDGVSFETVQTKSKLKRGK